MSSSTIEQKYREFQRKQVLLTQTQTFPKKSKDPPRNHMAKLERQAVSDVAKLAVGVINAFVTQDRTVGCITREGLRTIAQSINVGFPDKKYREILAFMQDAGYISIEQMGQGMKPSIIALEDETTLSLMGFTTDLEDPEWHNYRIIRKNERAACEVFVAKKAKPAATSMAQPNVKAKPVHTVQESIVKEKGDVKDAAGKLLLNALQKHIEPAIAGTNFKGFESALKKAIRSTESHFGVELEFFCSSAQFFEMLDRVLAQRCKPNDPKPKWKFGGEIYLDLKKRAQAIAAPYFTQAQVAQ